MVKRFAPLLFCAAGLLVLILDTQTALAGVSEGISICIYTVIPSLFPFIFISSLLVNQLIGKNFILLSRLGKVLRIPKGSEVFLLVGLLGGYPTGALCIADNYRAGNIKKGQAEQLLGFCNNAGPAFIFGMASSMFAGLIPWALWGIHIASALITALILPKQDDTPVIAAGNQTFSLTSALNHSIKAMATVCGWVILFRILISFFSRWFLWLLPEVVQCILIGAIELSNGCCNLVRIDSSMLRFILFSALLSVGGICITMQTRSAAEALSMQWYIIGKIIQCFLSVLFCVLLLPVLFPDEISIRECIYPATLLLGVLIAIKLTLMKKTVAFPKWLIYNKEKASKG